MTATRTLCDFTLTSLPTGAPAADLPPASSPEWITAIVPGGVHESLIAAGRIPHPYRDDNVAELRWIEDRDWWYRTEFDTVSTTADATRRRLVLLGLDTVAEIWLNGIRLGAHENMHRPAEFTVTDQLTEHNELLVRFAPPLAGLTAPAGTVDELVRLSTALAPPDERGTAAPPDRSALAQHPRLIASQRRKAICSWGWDFGPRLPSIGIWRDVVLLEERQAAITTHHLTTEAIRPDGTAVVTVTVEIERLTPGTTLNARVDIHAPDGTANGCELRFDPGISRSQLSVEIKDAALWWTHDLGTPALYEIEVTLLDGRTTLDIATSRLGIRTITLDQTPDVDGGRLFRFVLNGVPTFARGAAWLPADMMIGSVTAERRRELITQAVAANMNMLRIWGGGIYEDDAFYNACDDLGVLVWQDFMFACVDYPSGDNRFLAEVEAEARYQVARLRTHPSIALWCGNNEVQLLHGIAYGSYDPAEQGGWGWELFHELLPGIVLELDEQTPYWPGSPWGESTDEGSRAVNGVLDGDRHAWEVWHGMDFGTGGGTYATVGQARHYSRYARDTGKFISEYGIHASPELSTLARWINPSDLQVHSPVFDAHNNDHPKDKHDPVLDIVTGLPTTLPEYVDFTMASQAEGLKFGTEHYRRRQPHTSGTLVWQLNDVWPGFSWSLIDYDGTPKAAWYAIKRAFAPVLASFRRTDEHLELWLSNSGRTKIPVSATVTVTTVDGTVLLRADISTTIAAGDSHVVWTAPASVLTTDRIVWVDSPNGAFPTNRLFPTEIQNLLLEPCQLITTVSSTGDGTATIEITTDRLAYAVHVPTPAPGVTFSDNYLDIRPGETRRIEAAGLPAGFDPQSLTAIAYAGQRA